MVFRTFIRIRILYLKSNNEKEDEKELYVQKTLQKFRHTFFEIFNGRDGFISSFSLQSLIILKIIVKGGQSFFLFSILFDKFLL